MILGVAGLQNSGKTQLLELLIPRIAGAGFSVVTVKHIAHDDLAIDTGGRDTFRHKQAGAKVAVAASDTETVFFHARGQTLDEILERLPAIEPADLVFVEGYKASPIPKIVVGKVEHGGPALFRWDGTREGAAHIGEQIMERLRAERAGARRGPSLGKTPAAPRGVRGRRKAPTGRLARGRR